MMNTITIKTGNVKTNKKDDTLYFDECICLVPKNVANVSYFQLAVQYHAYKYFEEKLAGEIEKLRLELDTLPEDDSYADAVTKLNNDINNLSSMQSAYADEYKAFKERVNGLIDTFEADRFADMYALLKCKIGTYSGTKRITDKKGNVSLNNVTPALYGNYNDYIEKHTKKLQDVFNPDTPCKKEVREEIFDGIREIANFYMPDRTNSTLSTMYKNITMNKLNGKYINEYYSCTGKMSNGKNGGSKYSVQKSMNLHIQLWHTMARYLGCEEDTKSTANARQANDAAVQAINDLINSSRASEDTSK